MIRRNKKYTIDEIFSWIEISPTKIRKYKKELDGDLINPTSLRYKVFKLKGVKCVKCGIEGKYFIKERDINNPYYHLNLYGVDKNGNEILMTKDHVFPKSKGGKDTLKNFQTMCFNCNKEKGDMVDE
jgi:5-methylcytosine-specific restriction endonuclease McrA